MRSRPTRRARSPAASSESDHWFVQKRFGYGAVPVTWQGWLSVMLYIAAVALLAWLLPTALLRLAAIVPVTAAYLVLVGTRTEGGLQWRWGSRPD